MMTLAEIILLERRRQNLSQTDLAAKACVHRNTVSIVEKGDLNIRLSTLGAIIDALGFEWKIDIRPIDKEPTP